MDSMNDSLSASSDPKTAIIRQIQQEAAINNARQLIDVSQGQLCFSQLLLIQNAENEQPLLPEMRPHARQLVIEKGRNLL